MSSADTSQHLNTQHKLSNTPLLQDHVKFRILIIALIFIPLHWDILNRLVRFGLTDGDWSHIFLIPLVSLYFIFQHREDIQRTPTKTSWIGLAIILVAITGFFASIYPLRNDMLKGYFMILNMIGIAWFLCGTAMMRWLWFPIVYLALGVKISAKLWELIAAKLQYIAAQSATVILKITGIEADVQGTVINLFNGINESGMPISAGTLNVAQACSGLRMLMSFIALGVAMAYLWNRPWWARLLMVALTIPIAVFVNVLRVAVLGMGTVWYDPALAEGDSHIAIGMLMLIPAMLMFLLLGWILDNIVKPIDPEDRSKPSKSKTDLKPEPNTNPQS